MIQIKKTILTLVALLAMTAGAWAQGKLIYEKDFSSDTYYPFYLDAADKTGASATVTDGLLVLTNPKLQDTNWDVQPEIGRLTSAAPTTQGNTYRVVMQYKTTVAGSVTFALGAQDWSNADWSGQTITVSNDFQTCEAYFNNYPYSNSESHILLQFGELVGTITIKKVEVYELYPFDGISWTASTKTATIASMPAGNLFVVPEYYTQATMADGAVTAADADARATTDDPLVKVDATKLTGAKKLMYFVSNSGTTAPAYDAEGWTDQLPNAEGFTQQGIVYVWYYPVGTDEGVDGATATYSDGDICLQSITARIAAAPTYAVTFAEGTDPNEWTASPATGVTKGQTVTVTYTGTKKVIGVKAEKKAKTAAVPEYYDKLTKINDSGFDQLSLLKNLGRGKTPYNSSLTAAQAYALATYQAAIDGKPVYVIMSSQDEGYSIHYALSTDAAATEHTADVYNIVNDSNPVRMYYVAQ